MTTSKTMYLIHHGEKPSKVDGKDPVGLSDAGKERAQCLTKTFSKTFSYNISHVFVPVYKEYGERERAYLTVKPLANDLGIEIQTSSRNKADELVDEIKDVLDNPSSKNVLVFWEHDALTEIVVEIWKKLGGIKHKDQPTPPQYQPANEPDRFDIIWTMPPPYTNDPSLSITSENTSADKKGNQPGGTMPGPRSQIAQAGMVIEPRVERVDPWGQRHGHVHSFTVVVSVTGNFLA